MSKSDSYGSDSESRSSSWEPKENRDDLYRYLKDRLIHDKGMMPYGSDAYGSIYSSEFQTVALADPILWQFNQNLLNIDHVLGSPDIYVRKDGVFAVVLALNTNEAGQFSIFVNDKLVDKTSVGKNSGAGQLIIRTLLELKADDKINVRNYSSLGPVDIQQQSGGTLIGTNAEILLTKISPLPCQKAKCLLKYPKKRHHLFREILEKMSCDRSLVLNDQYAHGTFWTSLAQTIAVGDSITFEYDRYVEGMTHVLGTGDVTLTQSGSYLIESIIDASTSSQFSLFTNGAVNLTTTTGIDKGAGILYLRQILAFNAGDVLSIRNWTSAIGAVTLAPNSGGNQTSLSAILLVNRIGPLISDLCEGEIVKTYPGYNKPEDWCKDKWGYDELPRGKDKLYEQYKTFLLKKKWLAADGSHGYGDYYNTNQVFLNQEDSIVLQLNTTLYHQAHVTGTDKVKILKSGLYRITLNVETDQPAQFTIFVNGVADATTTGGTNTGASEVTIKQHVVLKKGDVVTVVNHTSFITPINTSQNPAGSSVTVDCILQAIWIAPIPQNCDIRKRGK